MSAESIPLYICHYCPLPSFKTLTDFERHLRERHCSQEGGSFICRYGYNGICVSLPLDGVTELEYERHVRLYHSTAGDNKVETWSVFSAAQNLPAVLNDPNRSKQPTFFTKTWGDTFTEKVDIICSPYLPDITYSHFEAYIRRAGKKLRRRERFSTQQNQDCILPKVCSPNLDNFDLSPIPKIFFKPNLPLNNAETFNVVFPALNESTQDSRTSCRNLQEELSQYLDIVEVQIAHQVSEKSEAFFNAMLSHDTIMDQMSTTVTLVKKMRRNMAEAKSSLSTEPLKLINLARFKNNTSKVYDKLKLMLTVHQTQPTIQLLLSSADYVTALDLIGTTQAILSRELSGVHAFRHLPSQLTEMERLIDKMLNTEFHRFVTADLNRPPGDDAISTDEDKLICVISGLLRRKRFDFIETYKEEAVATIQTTLKQAVIEEVAGQESEAWVRGTGEHSGLCGAGPVDLLQRATPRLIILLKRVLSLRKLVLRACSAGDVALIDGEEFFTPQEQQLVESKLQNLVDSLCDYCLERCSSLVNATDKEKIPLTGDQMIKLCSITDNFTNQCEEISSKKCITLKTAFKNQATRFIQRFHNDKRNKLTLLLDNERWKRAEVPNEFQMIVDRIQEHGKFPENNVIESEKEKSPASFLIVNKEPYTVVGVVLLTMKTIGEYCLIGNDIDGARFQAGRSLAEFFKLFNSRSCQLVLGVGALQSAGLKTITAANLALASRALQLLQWLLTISRRHFEDVDTNQILLKGFDSVEKDIASHIKEIENKLSGIAGGLLESQLNSWEARPPVPSQQFRNISRHLLKLHDALASVLPSDQLSAVFQTVHKNFKDKLREQLAKMNIVGNGGPQHGVVTSELTFYIQTLVSLQVLAEEELNLNSMDDIWIK